MDPSRGPTASPIARPGVPWFLRSRTRLLSTLIAVIAIPFAIFNYSVARKARETVEQGAIEMNTARARLGADAVRTHFDGVLAYVRGFAARPALIAALDKGDADEIRSHLLGLVRENSTLGRAFITDPDAFELYDYPPDPQVIGMKFDHRDWYKGVTARKDAYVSEIYLRAAEPRVDVVALAVPIRRPGKDVVLGYLVAQYELEALTRLLDGVIAMKEKSLTVFDQHGRPALQGDPKKLRESEVLQRMFTQDHDVVFAEDPATQEPSLLCSARVGKIGWQVLSSVPTRVMLEPAGDFRARLFLTAGVCLAGMLALGFVWLNVVRRHHLALIDLQRQKDLLSGMVLHDLRNPLAVTMGSLDLARAHSQDLDPGIREDLSRAARSARRARELLNTLLDIMRMEEGALALNLERIDLGALVRGKVDEYQPLARSTSVALSAVLPEFTVEASLDVDLIGRVLDNLVTNAVKHTPPGGKIEVRVEPEPKERRVALSVADTGEGIPADALPLLFEKFTPIAGQQMNRPHDAGLGLVFCRMTVERHGGTIEARSERGKGSVFRVLLPLAAA